VQPEDHHSILTPEGVAVQLRLAGVGSRFVAGLIDQAIQWSLVLALIVGLAAAGSGSASTAGANEGGGSAALGAVAVVLFVFLITFGYGVLFETLASGRTPGKRWTGLRVILVEGGPIGFRTSAVRNLLRLVDMIPGFYGVGMVAVVLSPRNQRLGDMAAGTLVVRERVASRKESKAPIWTGATDTAAWDVGAVTGEELSTVRRFLDRRTGLTDSARQGLATELASRLRPKVVGPGAALSDEEFLEALAAAKSARV